MSTRVDAVWYSRCPSPTASSIAVAQGFLEREFEGTGVDVRSLRAASDRSVRQTHFTQEHEALFRQGGIVPPLWAAANHTATRLIGLTEIPRFQGVITLAGSGIEVPADLKGRRLALPRRTAEPVDFWRAHSWRGLLNALDIAGVGEGEVTWVDLPTDAPYHVTTAPSPDGSLWTAREAARLQSPEVIALIRGEVDAIYTYAPTGFWLIELLDARVVVSLPTSGLGAGGIGTIAALTVSQRLLDEHADLVVRYVRGLLRAAEWAQGHPDDALRVFAAEEGVPEEWASASFGAPPTFDLRPELSSRLLEVLQGEADFLHERRLIPGPVDVGRWSEGTPLRQAGSQIAHPAAAPRPDHNGSGRLTQKEAS